MVNVSPFVGGVGLSRWDEPLLSLMGDPTGRLVLALCFFALVLVAVLLIVIPLNQRSIRLTFRRLFEGVEEIRRRGPGLGLPPDIDGEARDLVASLNHLLGELRGRMGALERRHDLVQAILDAPRDHGVVATDRDGRIQTLSAGACALLGYTAEELTGQSVEALFPEEDWNRIVPKLARRSLRETGLVQRVHMVRKDRSSFLAHLSVVGTGGSGAAAGFVSVFRDLTEQAALERRLQESEERHRNLVEAMPEGVVILQGGRIVYANPATGRILGRAVPELTGRPFKEFIAAEDLLLTLDRLEKVLEGSGPSELDLRLHRAGSSLPVEIRAVFSRIENQGSPALMGTLRDETDRKRFERDLTASRALLDATLDSTSDGILVVDVHPGRKGPGLVNRRAAELLGAGAEEILSWSGERLRRGIAGLCTRPEEAEALGLDDDPTSRSVVLEIRGVPPRFLEVSVGPLSGAAGEFTGRIYSFRDVTEPRRAEETLRRSHEALLASRKELEATVTELKEARESLASRNEQLEKLNQELRSLDQIKSNLLANVSHELQTPLVLIKGYTEMILKRKIGPITPEQEKGLTVALRNIDRLVEMIDNLLGFSRIERGDAPLQLEEFPLWQLIDEVIELLKEKIQKSGVYLTTQYETDDLTVRADRGKVAQVFINLLTNAIKFNREGGRITVRVLKGARGMLDVEVQDTGIGIPVEEQGRIFERFYQVDSSPRKRHEGTGIGLAIVKEILAVHGCSIRVESQAGKGSTFAFHLPMGRSSSPPGPGSGGTRAKATENERTRR